MSGRARGTSVFCADVVAAAFIAVAARQRAAPGMYRLTVLPVEVVAGERLCLAGQPSADRLTHFKMKDS